MGQLSISELLFLFTLFFATLSLQEERTPSTITNASNRILTWISPINCSCLLENSKENRPGAKRYRRKGMSRRNYRKPELVSQFHLYHDHRNMDYEDIIVIDDYDSLRNYNPSFYPVILIHGFMENYTDFYPQRTKNAYLRKKYPANIIIMDWKNIAQPDFGFLTLLFGYSVASKKVDRLGEDLVTLIKFLIRSKKLSNLSTVHIIGAGLGAQIAAFAGQKLKFKFGTPIGRITGIDPTGLQFHLSSKTEDKLDQSDALFVDVLHTLVQPVSRNAPIGHVDFYPNGGGIDEPSCVEEEESCQQGRGWEYFTDSVLNGNIVACKASSYKQYKNSKFCKNPVYFGQGVTNTARGRYYLQLKRLKTQHKFQGGQNTVTKRNNAD